MRTDKKASRIKRCLILSQRVWTRAIDFCLNIETVPPAREAGWLGDSSALYKPAEKPLNPLHNDGLPYAAPNYLHLWRVRRRLKAGPEDVFWDIGCGMGRMVCVMARGTASQCIGIELFPSLCDIAVRNAKRLRGRKACIGIVCGDAATADLSRGTIYFMFNPFGTATMKQVLARIEASRFGCDRPIAIVYYNSVHADLVDRLSWLKRIDSFSTFTGRSVAI